MCKKHLTLICTCKRSIGPLLAEIGEGTCGHKTRDRLVSTSSPCAAFSLNRSMDNKSDATRLQLFSKIFDAKSLEIVSERL